VVHVDAGGNLYVNGIRQANQNDTVARLQTIMETAADKTVLLKGDRNAPYGAIMSMMDALRGAKIETVGLITEKRGGNLPAEKGGGS